MQGITSKKVHAAGGVKVRVCFWCDCPSNRLTRDHVVPRANGGVNVGFNVVMACVTCNQDRARIASLFSLARELRAVAKGGLPADPQQRAKFRKRVEKQRRAQADNRFLLLYWAELERRRWGSSPSAALDLSLPEVDAVPPAPPPAPPARPVPTPPVARREPAPRPLTGWELD